MGNPLGWKCQDCLFWSQSVVRADGGECRCYSPGAKGWTEAQSRKNFEQVQRLVVPGNPAASRLLLMPLAEEVGGIHFHPGGKHFMSLTDPEWKGMADWVQATK